MAEGHIEHTIGAASPYLHDSFEGEAILTVGKAVEYYHDGFSGVINVMPFTCMPGTIVNALLKRCREDLDQIPVITFSYDGQRQSNIDTRLEAFLYQVRQYSEMKWK